MIEQLAPMPNKLVPFPEANLAQGISPDAAPTGFEQLLQSQEVGVGKSDIAAGLFEAAQAVAADSAEARRTETLDKPLVPILDGADEARRTETLDKPLVPTLDGADDSPADATAVVPAVVPALVPAIVAPIVPAVEISPRVTADAPTPAGSEALSKGGNTLPPGGNNSPVLPPQALAHPGGTPRSAEAFSAAVIPAGKVEEQPRSVSQLSQQLSQLTPQIQQQLKPQLQPQPQPQTQQLSLQSTAQSPRGQDLALDSILSTAAGTVQDVIQASARGHQAEISTRAVLQSAALSSGPEVPTRADALGPGREEVLRAVPVSHRQQPVVNEMLRGVAAQQSAAALADLTAESPAPLPGSISQLAGSLPAAGGSAITTPTQAMAAPARLEVPAPLGTTAWGEQLHGRLQMVSRQGIEFAELQLHPAELGKLEIQIKTENDRANIVFFSQNRMARELIEAELPRLREMFADAGIELGDSDVSEHSMQEHREQALQQQAAVTGAGRAVNGEPESAGSPVSQSVALGSPGQSLIDFYV